MKVMGAMDDCMRPEEDKVFTNDLSVIPGVISVALSYVMLKEAFAVEGSEYSRTFSQKMISRAPTAGPYYIAGAKRIHNAQLPPCIPPRRKYEELEQKRCMLPHWWT